MRDFSAAVMALMFAAPAHAQRDAVSPDLSPETAAGVFRSAVMDVCVPAVTRNGVSALPAAQQGKLRPTQDAETRKQAGAGPDEIVWDVVGGKGVVTLREKAGRCVVSVYGPPAGATVAAVAGAASDAGFRTEGYRFWQPEQPENIAANMTRAGSDSPDGKGVAIRAEGANPGAPGHQSRFSVVTATVTRAQ